VLDITWKVFSQTGNIETYLLLKELENVGMDQEERQTLNDTESFHPIETIKEL